LATMGYGASFTALKGLLDTFEWIDGYSQPYGIRYADFRSQKRTVKDSGVWYGRVAVANHLDVSLT
jgi:beta-glucosidase